MGNRVVANACRIVQERGRAYLYKGKYPQLVVFTKSMVEVDKLIQEFGGHYYKHCTGLVWQLSRRVALAALLEKMKPYPSRYGFESILHNDGGVKT